MQIQYQFLQAMKFVLSLYPDAYWKSQAKSPE